MKKLIALFLAVVLCVGLVPFALAATDEANTAAQALYDAGLFKGTGTNDDGAPNFDLDRTPTRHEAVTMLVRLLGKDAEAQTGAWETPFTDVADWAKPYVGYAYTNGLTTGTSATTYGGDALVDAAQYLTFVLRALGYTSGTDFQWDKPWELSDKIGLTSGRYNAGTVSFTRGDVAVISRCALDVKKEANSPVSESTPIESTAPDKVKNSIINDYAQGLEYLSEGSSLMGKGMMEVSSALRRGKDPAQALLPHATSAQKSLQNAQNSFRSAANRCRPYGDTQVMMGLISKYIDTLEGCVSFDVTYDTVVDYEQMYSKALKECDKYFDACIEEIDNW